MDNNTPDWLREADAPAPAAPSNNTMTTVPLPPPPVAPETADEVEPEELPGVILTMRLANMGLAVAIVVVSVSCSLYCQTIVLKKKTEINLLVLVVLLFFLLDPHHGATKSQFLCLGHLCDVRRIAHLLSGNPAKVCSRHDCPQFWIFIQFLLALFILFNDGLRQLEF